MALVAVRDVSFSYGPKPVFDRIGFNVEKGEIFCLIGPNGCGKTTLLDCLLGLHTFDSGSFELFGRDASRLSARKVAQAMAYVPQLHERTFPYTVREIVTMGRAAYLGFFESPSTKDDLLADDALKRIGIGELADRPYTQLSGGEVQLVMLARALVQQTPIVVMDEPTAHLDFRHELRILEIVSTLVREKNLSIIMATHFPNHAYYFQSKQIQTTVALFHKGGFIAIGDPESVIDKHHLQELYGIQADVTSVAHPDGNQMKHIVALKTVAEGESIL